MRSQAEVNAKLNESRFNALEAISERDRRIAYLERDLERLRGRRPDGVVLIGGPKHGTIEPILVSKAPGQTFEVLLPPTKVEAVFTSYATVEDVPEVRVGRYRIERVQTASYEPSYIGIWQGER